MSGLRGCQVQRHIRLSLETGEVLPLAVLNTSASFSFTSKVLAGRLFSPIRRLSCKKGEGLYCICLARMPAAEAAEAAECRRQSAALLKRPPPMSSGRQSVAFLRSPSVVGAAERRVFKAPSSDVVGVAERHLYLRRRRQSAALLKRPSVVGAQVSVFPIKASRGAGFRRRDSGAAA